ncbi:hypothetical protein KQI38_01870 [Tissierella carlieri]|uniref:Peptidase C39-like domain-containing protein n=2 Tax=Tissierella TaxID=41273 RepID=A0ABT1SA58_9FIRM|nr:hypothetical protein [Tissierella carlieri]MBU5310763.1 hypothetical protein [Tissierella carlieri]MCQ4923227.1 hypothetical protein [Tissierella carlieri]MDU5079756.1 hypothetical protein [Bacillota bacterium]
MTNLNTTVKENIIEEAYLTDHEDFVKVNNLYYGGLQKWLYMEKLRTKFWADRSCGVTAAGNALIHMAMYRKGLEDIYRYPGLSRVEFTRFIDEIYRYVKPNIFGIPSLGKLNKRLKSFAKSKGVILDAKSLSMPKDVDTAINFIKEGLMIDSPVLMLTWNSKIKNLRYHWVTITGYVKDLEGINYIITSNWGQKEMFSLDNWIKEKNLYRGLIYFYQPI